MASHKKWFHLENPKIALVFPLCIREIVHKNEIPISIRPTSIQSSTDGISFSHRNRSVCFYCYSTFAQFHFIALELRMFQSSEMPCWFSNSTTKMDRRIHIQRALSSASRKGCCQKIRENVFTKRKINHTICKQRAIAAHPWFKPLYSTFIFWLSLYPVAPRYVSTCWWSSNGVFGIIISFFYCSIWNYLGMMLTNLVSIRMKHIPIARIGFTFCLAKPSDSWHRTRCVCWFEYGYAINTVNYDEDDSADSAQHCSLLSCVIHALTQTLYLFLSVYPWFAHIISHSKMPCTQLVHHTVHRNKIFRRTVYMDDG